MSKSKKSGKKGKKAQSKDASPSENLSSAKPQSSIIGRYKWHPWIIFAMGILLYANTLTHRYTQDDAIVITENMFTQEGVSGIPGILGNDTFFGFFKVEGKAKLVSGGRYRPFTLIMYAIEYQLFGKNPFVGHFISILLYGLLGFMIYKMMALMLLGQNKAGKKEGQIRTFILVACLLYIAHPIHTEAVANIKGRDEIMTMLGSVAALWASLKYYHTKAMKWNIWAMLFFFIALMSKENAITFLAVVPLVYIFFKRVSPITALKYLWPFMVSTILFLGIRTAILGMDFGGQSMELMNNPFLKLVNNTWTDFSGGEKFATILFTLGKYIVLLIFPHPLSHDYYPRAVEIMSFGDWQVLLSLVLYIAIIGGGLFFWKRDKLISFGLLYYIITLSIVSNIVFPIGTNMSERFLFMPSLGIMIVLARVLTMWISNRNILYGILGIILLGFAAKTVTRNMVWKDDFTLFTTDVKNQSRSAKLLNAAGGALTTTAGKMENGPEKTKSLNQAIEYLNKAVEIHPTYRNAYLLLGNAYYYKEDFLPAIAQYEKLRQLYPDFQDANKNYPVILRDAGKYYGQIKNDIAKSEEYLTRSYQLSANDPETLRLLGIVNGIKNDHDRAISYFEKALQLDPNVAASYVNLATAYRNKGDAVKAAEYYNKAQELDPNALDQITRQ